MSDTSNTEEKSKSPTNTSTITYSTVAKSESDISSPKEPITLQMKIGSPLLDISRNRYPYCIVWTPLPLITAIIPCIGHTGICTSDGVIHDFAGSYYIGIDNMAFGNPHKYVMLNPDEREKARWDKAVEQGDERYNTEEHNLFTNNCHSHCAYVLNKMKYKGRTNYTMISIWWMMCTKSKYVSWVHILKTYIGFFVIVMIIVLISIFMK